MSAVGALAHVPVEPPMAVLRIKKNGMSQNRGAVTLPLLAELFVKTLPSTTKAT